MKPSEFNISLSVKSYDKKPAENYQKFYDAKMQIVLKLFKISIPNVDRTILKLKSRLCQHFTFLSSKLSEK